MASVDGVLEDVITNLRVLRTALANVGDKEVTKEQSSGAACALDEWLEVECKADEQELQQESKVDTKKDSTASKRYLDVVSDSLRAAMTAVHDMRRHLDAESNEGKADSSDSKPNQDTVVKAKNVALKAALLAHAPVMKTGPCANGHVSIQMYGNQHGKGLKCVCGFSAFLRNRTGEVVVRSISMK